VKTVVLGLGNPVLSDDGVGLELARRLEGRLTEVTVCTTQLVGLSILELIEGYDLLFVIDAVSTRGGSVGTLARLGAQDGSLHLFSSHGLDFYDLLALGARLGMVLPRIGQVYGIEIGDRVAFGETVSPVLESRLDGLIEEIATDIQQVCAVHCGTGCPAAKIAGRG